MRSTSLLHVRIFRSLFLMRTRSVVRSLTFVGTPPTFSGNTLVKQAKEVDIRSLGNVFASDSNDSNLIHHSKQESAICPKNYFRIGGEVTAKIRKTHFLGVLMSISPQDPLQESESSDEPAHSRAVTFMGLLPHLEIEFYRKSAGRSIRLDEEYRLFVQNVTPHEEGGLIRLSFRPSVRDRINLGKQAILEALESTDRGRIPVGEASSAEDIRRLFFGLSKSDFKRCLGSLYKEHRIERPAGKIFTQLTSEEVRLDLLARDEAIEHEIVQLHLQNLPLSIKTATLAQHIMAHMNNMLHKKPRENMEGSSKISENIINKNENNDFSVVKFRTSLKGINFGIQHLRIRQKNSSTSVATLHLQISGKASQMSQVGLALTSHLKEENNDLNGMTLLAETMLNGLVIGKKVTVRGVSGSNIEAA